MKYICLGYVNESAWESLSPAERDACMSDCMAFSEDLKKNGHELGCLGLQSARTASTLRWQNGKVVVTDGPYAETKEQLGGLLVIEARDMEQAIALISKHPGLRLGGPFEIRAAEDIGLPDGLSRQPSQTASGA
jgi:hypothetical protein